jgi:phage gp29-like protein
MQLYDQFNRPIKPTRKPESRTLAAAPILDSWREYVSAGVTPQKMAALFREADAGDVSRQAMLFDQIEEKDGHLLGEKSKRQNVILDMDFTVTPASDDARGIRIADFVRDFLDARTDWDDVLVSLQDAVGKGFVGIDIDWDVSSGQAMPEKFNFIEQKRFLFTDRNGYVRQEPLLLTDENPMGDEIPAWRMLFHRYGGMSGHPTRSGVFRVCAWWYLFKNYSVKDWVSFCEIYGMPLRLGKYDTGATKDDKDALITAITTLGTDAAGIISKSTEIEFIDTLNAAAKGDLYEGLAKFANAEMSKAILGQTLTAEVGDKGSYAASQTHNDVRKDLLKADGRAIATTVRNQLLRPLVGFNFGWDATVPLFEAVLEEDEDLNKKAEWVEKLLDRGVVMPVKWLRQEFKIPEPEPGDEVVGGPVASGQSTVDSGSTTHVAKAGISPADDPTPASTLDALGRQALAGADMDDMIKPIEELLARANSLEEFRDGLLEKFADMDEQTMADNMAKAMAAADLAGRFDAEN